MKPSVPSTSFAKLLSISGEECNSRKGCPPKGKGTIDLVMHSRTCGFQEAVNVLSGLQISAPPTKPVSETSPEEPLASASSENPPFNGTGGGSFKPHHPWLTARGLKLETLAALTWDHPGLDRRLSQNRFGSWTTFSRSKRVSTSLVRTDKSTSRRSSKVDLPPAFSMIWLSPQDSSAKVIASSSSNVLRTANPIDSYQATVARTSGT